MIKIDFLTCLDVFNKHYSIQKDAILTLENKDECNKKISLLKQKYIHSMEVVNDGTKVAMDLDFNDSFKELIRVCLLDHDIGRFNQVVYTGTYYDSDLKRYDQTLNHHGQLGKRVLDSLIIHQIPSTRVFDEPIKEVVEQHVLGRCDNELYILATDILKKENSFEIFNSNDNINKVIVKCMTQIVQDVDRLDIYHQILDGRWNPKKTNLEVDYKVLDMFYNGEYLNINDLKQKGLWNDNVGELVRLSFIHQIKLLSVAKLIKEENIIMKLKEVRGNKVISEAFDFMNDKLDEMINNSEDGITVKVKR